ARRDRAGRLRPAFPGAHPQEKGDQGIGRSGDQETKAPDHLITGSPDLRGRSPFLALLICVGYRTAVTLRTGADMSHRTLLLVLALGASAAAQEQPPPEPAGVAGQNQPNASGVGQAF